jgi:[lysine-biosynthesis-protein LysW]--L-2-aminoadipate ligase
MLCSRVRVEEKLILSALRQRGIDFARIDPRRLAIDVAGHGMDEYDAVLVRCLSHTRAYYLTHWLECRGVPAVSAHHIVATCGDKMLTSIALHQAGIPIPGTAFAFAPDAAVSAMEDMGYPVVVKPLAGSWGRLLARINDRDAAEAILEHKTTLGGYQHGVVYIQDFVDKPGRDIRTLVVGSRVVYAVYRLSAHWITNTARGGETQPCPISPEIADLSVAAARAVGVGPGQPGIVAVDLLETADGQLLVNEVNHTPEFHGAMQATETNVADEIVDYVLEVAREVR